MPATARRGQRNYVQKRMAVGASDDRFEREADRIANHVVGPSALPAAAPPPAISPLGAQRMQVADPAPGPEEPLQPKRKAGPEVAKEEEPTAKTAPVQRSMRATGPESPKDAQDDLSKALTVQSMAKPGAEGGQAPASVESSIQRMRAGPAPGLDKPVRERMEHKMGVDLGGVRVHTGATASKAADGLNAKAFTVGQDIRVGFATRGPVLVNRA